MSKLIVNILPPFRLSHGNLSLRSVQSHQIELHILVEKPKLLKSQTVQYLFAQKWWRFLHLNSKKVKCIKHRRPHGEELSFELSRVTLHAGWLYFHADFSYSHMNQTASKDEWEFLLYCLGRDLGEKLGDGLPTQRRNYILLHRCVLQNEQKT